ncbi:DUF4350 domain-containing protein, partial [Allosalinactinospora lopnorensis]|uniref:DUF4350 domain-containing protein n=1 Tax=Allosalinactinospora lopnorensis TaxID=1352348 RepID=UPI000698E5BB
MTAGTSAPSGSQAPVPVSPGPGEFWRRARGPLAFLGGLVLLAVLLSLGAEDTPEGFLEPEGPNPQGARALAQILQQRGAEVTVARETDEAAAAAAADDTVLVLAQSHRLLPEELDRIADTPGDRILVQPTTQALGSLAPGAVMSGRTEDSTLSADCELPAARAAGNADTGGELFAVEAAGDQEGTAGCYPADDGAALLRVPRDDGATTVLGSAAPLTNERLGREGNAALALNLVGESDVVWFLPDVPAQAGQATLWELLPRSFHLALVPLGVTLLMLALWRGRRMGPLVTERLPVVVRASETTEGRAGLYASRRARGRAAAAP